MRNGPYLLVIAPADYPGKRYRDRYCYEHHLVWWQNTGQTLAQGECVHHLNEDKHDNRFENLAKLTVEEHSHHHGEQKEPELLTIVCAFCQSKVSKPARNIRVKIKKGQKDFYCGRSCMAKHFGAYRPKVIDTPG